MNGLLHVSLMSKRMLTKAEAAHHCGLSVRKFVVDCPITPVRFPNGPVRWDVHDLDRWLDGLKDDASGIEAIVGRLG